MIESFKELYKYREMLINLVRKDLRTRYKGSILGFLWTFINPLLQLVVYSVVFKTIMRMNIPNFSMFLFVGLLPWIFFSSSILISTSIILSNKDLIKKIFFPREILPISVVTSGLMNFFFGFVIVIPALLITGVHISKAIFFLPLIIIVEYVVCLAFSFLFSALNVYFRDLEHILGILMMAWFYFTPVIYPVTMIPAPYVPYFYLNPMTTIVLSYRDVLFYGKAPDFKALGICFICGFVLLVISYWVYRVLQKNFAEEI